MKRFRITVVRRDRKIKKFDWVTEEIPLAIVVNKKRVATLLCAPGDLRNLVCGFLFTSSVINEISQIKRLVIDKRKNAAIIKVAAQDFKKNYIKKTRPDFFIKKEKLFRLMEKFKKNSPEFRKTGAVHSAALCSPDKIIVFRDDPGRHNAADKVIGETLLKGIDVENKIFLTSGRIASEILQKILKLKIPIIASVSAPLDSSIKLARKNNVTLIGFLRDRRMNIYSGEERVR